MMHQGELTTTRKSIFFPVWVRQRELSHQLPLEHTDEFHKSLYSSISLCHSWRGGKTSQSVHGGLFSLDFSPDGTLLVAGCEKNSLLMFDPLSRRLIRTVHKAHASTVTQVKFLDSRIFATGDVDETVSLWDTRNLKTRCRALRGHSSTIANIEFSRRNDLLITSGLNGYIYMWDMKNWNLREVCSSGSGIFMSHVLLRLRLNPDETKMIISTASGYLLIVHELDLNTLAQDLDEFGLEMFEFAYWHQTIFASCQNWNRFAFSKRRRNRVEIVADFPNAGVFNMIPALEIHPQGRSAISRSMGQASGTKWTCVHDIQEKESFEGGTAPREWSGVRGAPSPQHLERIHEGRCNARGSTGTLGNASVGFCVQSNNDSDSLLRDAGALETGSVSPTDTAQPRNPLPNFSSAPPLPQELPGPRSNLASSRTMSLSLPRPSSSDAHVNRRIHERFPRLTHYIQDPNSSDFCIDSLSVSADGRLVCSPLERGFRLLAFSPECSEPSDSWCGTYPRRLHELSSPISQSGRVLTTKFSPRHCLLVSGCLDGKLAWFEPVV